MCLSGFSGLFLSTVTSLQLLKKKEIFWISHVWRIHFWDRINNLIQLWIKQYRVFKNFAKHFENLLHEINREALFSEISILSINNSQPLFGCRLREKE